ncbi:MATE family efflux transporter [Treponema parvum]|nr:MATE family efflux transporter [Treponema parvum]
MMKTQKVPGFYKNFFLIAVPITLQQLMQTFVNMLDTIMVGQLGAVEIASVGLGNQIFFILNMILFGIASGGSIFIAQYWGKNDVRRIRQVLGIMLSASVAVSLIFTLATLFIPEILIGFYSKDPKVIECGAKYLRAVGLSYPATAISFAYQFSFRSTEHVRLPMFSTFVSVILNAFFNLILIFGLNLSFSGVRVFIPALGVLGAAVATFISRSIEMTIILCYSYSKKYEPCGTLKELLSFDRAFVAKFIKTALPVLFNETLWGTGITFENAIFARIGTKAIAAFNITGTISQLSWVFVIGFGSAAGIIIGKQIGAGNEKSARAYAKHFAFFIPAVGFAVGCLLYPFSLFLPSFFKVEPDILRQAQLMLWTLIWFYPFNSFNMLFIVGICRSGGDTRYAAFHDLFWMWAIIIPMGFVTALVFRWQPWQVYACLLCENIFKSIAGIIRVRSGKWLNNVTT